MSCYNFISQLAQLLSNNGGDPRAILAVLNYILTHSLNRKLIMEASKPDPTEADEEEEEEEGEDYIN